MKAGILIPAKIDSPPRIFHHLIHRPPATPQHQPRIAQQTSPKPQIQGVPKATKYAAICSFILSCQIHQLNPNCNLIACSIFFISALDNRPIILTKRFLLIVVNWSAIALCFLSLIVTCPRRCFSFTKFVICHFTIARLRIFCFFFHRSTAFSFLRFSTFRSLR